MKKNEFLEKLRKDLGYSRKKIAEYLEVSASAIEKYEKGKLDFNHKTKYVLGICALAGYANEIFTLDEINEDTIADYKLTLFSSKLREILYFLNIEYDEYELFLIKLLQKTYKIGFILNTDYLLKNVDLKDRIINQNLYSQIDAIDFIKNQEKFIYDFKNSLRDKYNEKISDNEIKQLFERDKINFLANIRLEIMVLYTLKVFNPKKFYEENKLSFFKEALKDFNSFIKDFNHIAPVGIVPIYYWEKDEKQLKNLFPTIKQTIEELMIKGKPVNKETIKEFKIELETGAILSTCNEPTDPKDKQICELLQYAPPAFKDKIIEKLLKFKDEVEDI